MSVIRFDSEMIANIYKSLEEFTWNYSNQIDKVIPLNYMEYFEAKETASRLNEPIDYESFILNKITWWLQRVYASNQMAYIWQYAHNESISTEIEKIDMENLKGKKLATYELYGQLRSLRYNLYTNGGNCFIQEKDLTFLNEIISGLERREATRKFDDDEKSIKTMRERLAKEIKN